MKFHVTAPRKSNTMVTFQRGSAPSRLIETIRRCKDTATFWECGFGEWEWLIMAPELISHLNSHFVCNFILTMKRKMKEYDFSKCFLVFEQRKADGKPFFRGDLWIHLSLCNSSLILHYKTHHTEQDSRWTSSKPFI